MSQGFMGEAIQSATGGACKSSRPEFAVTAMQTLSRLTAFPVLAAILAGPIVRARDTDDRKKPVPMALALKLGPEDLTQYTDPSEAGQDNAAFLYATAKRVETESVLARRDVALVIELQHWRASLRKCRNGSSSLAYIVNGGGTMYSHGQARDCAPLEDFLAGLSKRLPLAKGKGDARAAKQVDDAVAFLKKLKPFDEGDATSTKAAKAELAAELKQVLESWTELKSMIGELSPDEAKRVADFAVESLGWLKEGAEK